MPEPVPSEPDQVRVKLPGLNVGRASTLLVGGAVSTVVLAWAPDGVGCTLPTLSVATLKKE